MPENRPEEQHPHAGQDERSIELDRAMESEPVAAGWAGKTAQALRTLAPQATEISCRTQTCRVVIVGSEKEIIAIADKLRRVADRVVATSPEDHDGTLLARLYVQYEEH